MEGGGSQPEESHGAVVSRTPGLMEGGDTHCGSWGSRRSLVAFQPRATLQGGGGAVSV